MAVEQADAPVIDEDDRETDWQSSSTAALSALHAASLLEEGAVDAYFTAQVLPLHTSECDAHPAYATRDSNPLRILGTLRTLTRSTWRL